MKRKLLSICFVAMLLLNIADISSLLSKQISDNFVSGKIQNHQVKMFCGDKTVHSPINIFSDTI